MSTIFRYQSTEPQNETKKKHKHKCCEFEDKCHQVLLCNVPDKGFNWIPLRCGTYLFAVVLLSFDAYITYLFAMRTIHIHSQKSGSGGNTKIEIMDEETRAALESVESFEVVLAFTIVAGFWWCVDVGILITTIAHNEYMAYTCASVMLLRIPQAAADIVMISLICSAVKPCNWFILPHIISLCAIAIAQYARCMTWAYGREIATEKELKLYCQERVGAGVYTDAESLRLPPDTHTAHTTRDTESRSTILSPANISQTSSLEPRLRATPYDEQELNSTDDKSSQYLSVPQTPVPEEKGIISSPSEKIKSPQKTGEVEQASKAQPQADNSVKSNISPSDTEKGTPIVTPPVPAVQTTDTKPTGEMKSKPSLSSSASRSIDPPKRVKITVPEDEDEDEDDITHHSDSYMSHDYRSRSVMSDQLKREGSKSSYVSYAERRYDYPKDHRHGSAKRIHSDKEIPKSASTSSSDTLKLPQTSRRQEKYPTLEERGSKSDSLASDSSVSKSYKGGRSPKSSSQSESDKQNWDSRKQHHQTDPTPPFVISLTVPQNDTTPTKDETNDVTQAEKGRSGTFSLLSKPAYEKSSKPFKKPQHAQKDTSKSDDNNKEKAMHVDNSQPTSMTIKDLKNSQDEKLKSDTSSLDQSKENDENLSEISQNKSLKSKDTPNAETTAKKEDKPSDKKDENKLLFRRKGTKPSLIHEEYNKPYQKRLKDIGFYAKRRTQTQSLSQAKRNASIQSNYSDSSPGTSTQKASGLDQTQSFSDGKSYQDNNKGDYSSISHKSAFQKPIKRQSVGSQTGTLPTVENRSVRSNQRLSVQSSTTQIARSNTTQSSRNPQTNRKSRSPSAVSTPAPIDSAVGSRSRSVVGTASKTRLSAPKANQRRFTNIGAERNMKPPPATRRPSLVESRDTNRALRNRVKEAERATHKQPGPSRTRRTFSGNSEKSSLPGKRP